MSCGCQTACGCTLVSEDGTIAITRQGDTYFLSAVQFIDSVDGDGCVVLSVTDEGELSADINFDDATPGTVELECGPDGLRGNLRIDPAGTLPITETEDGLRFDCCAPEPSGDGPRRAGDIFFSGVVGQIPDAYRCKGQRVPRSADSAPGGLFDALTLYATTGATLAGDPTVSGIPDTEDIRPGMTVEVDGFPGNPTVVSVDDVNTITLDTDALSTYLNTANVRVFVWGDGGDPTSFFQVPDGDQRVLVGTGDSGRITDAAATYMGGTLGSEDSTIAASMLPAHDHPATVSDPGHGHVVSDPGHTHTGSTNSAGSHAHDAGSAGDSDFVTVDHGIGAGDFRAVPIVSGGVIVGTAVSPSEVVSIPTIAVSGGGIVVRQQTNRASTNTTGSHSHTITAASATTGVSVLGSATGITVDVGNNVPPVGPDALPVIQPSLAARMWIQR